LHPEDCLLFEDWLSTFGALPSFHGTFIDSRGRSRDDHEVIGTRAPTTIPNPAPAALRGNTAGIERPWAGWLRNNLPPALVETAYELPTDCADIVLILRHVWLTAHGRTEQVLQWTLGRGVSREQIRQTTGDVGTANLKQGMIAFYRDANGAPIRSFSTVLPLLHPGDVLIWEHRNARGQRIGGHSETIQTISFNPTLITTLQGNQPLSPEPDDQLGSARGWRIERREIPAASLRDLNNVWTWSDNTTVLMGAGPWGGTQQARSRQPAARRGTIARVLRDWSTSLSSATTAGLSGVMEGALGEARAALEGQRNVPEAEARQVGEQIGRRLWALAHQAADLGVASHFEPLEHLLNVLEAYRLRTRPTGTSTQAVIDAMYNQMREAFELGARGATSLNFSAPTGRAPGSPGTRRVNILVTGFDPFEPGGSLTQPDPELWNTSGAAAMALDGANIPAGGRVVAAVESVVLPVDYRSFAMGMVEAIARPLLPSLDAVMTISMDSSLTGQAALERYAVNFHHVAAPVPGSTPTIESGPIPLPPVTGGGAAAAAGPAILPSWNQLDTLASSVQSPSGGIGFFARSSPLGLRFSTSQAARDALQDMGLSSGPEHSVSGRDVTFCAASGQMTPTQRSTCEASSVNRLLGVAQTPAGQPANRLRWTAFQTANTNFEADVQSGPGGDFLSNEVSYRMLRLLQQQGSAAASFHTHTPDAPRVPVAERTNVRSAARTAAMSVRSSVIAGLRALIIRVARLLRP
jgi:pyrrolidone-carboxylate peptidase